MVKKANAVWHNFCQKDCQVFIKGSYNTREVPTMNESIQATTSTTAQQIIGALYLLALLAAVGLILL